MFLTPALDRRCADLRAGRSEPSRFGGTRSSTQGRWEAGTLQRGRSFVGSEVPVLVKIVRAGRLDRTFYASLVHDEYASGTAVVVVAAVGLLPALGRGSLVDLLGGSIRAIMLAGLVAMAVWATSVHLHRSYGSAHVTFRLVGFAYVAFLPLVLRPWFVSAWVFWGTTVLSVLWFFLALRVIARVQYGLGHPENSLTAGAGVLGWYLGTILVAGL